MNHLDTFSGIGAWSLAAKWMGWNTLGFCEKDTFCQEVLKKNFAGVPIHDDIFTLTVDDTVNVCYNSLNAIQREEFDMAAHRKDYDQAVVMYNAGMSIGDAADFYNISRQAMWAILKRRGCEFRDQLKYGEDNNFYRGTESNGRVHRAVKRAIKKGILIPRTDCELCGQVPNTQQGRKGIEAHHSDYNKPLEVLWLCQKCHHHWHKENQAIPFKEVISSGASHHCSIDIMTGSPP